MLSKPQDPGTVLVAVEATDTCLRLHTQVEVCPLSLPFPLQHTQGLGEDPTASSPPFPHCGHTLYPMLLYAAGCVCGG